MRDEKWTKKNLRHEAAVGENMLRAWLLPNSARKPTRAFIHLLNLVEPLLNNDGTVKKAALAALTPRSK